jgi:hypothetical protein
MDRVTNNGHIVRTVIALALSLAIPAGALTIPLAHAHPDDHATSHHSGGAAHTHWRGHAQSHRSQAAAALRADDDDRAVFLNAFVAVASSTVRVPGITQGACPVVVPVEQPGYRAAEVTRSHDPPYIRTLSSRAPPALPVLT